MMKILSIILFLNLPVLLTACLSEGSGTNSDQVATVEKERDPVQIDCRTLGYEAVKALTTEVMQVPLTATLSNGQTLDAFLTTNQGVLGGVGAGETRNCSLLYFKSVAQLGMLSCDWVARNNATVLFPQGSDSSYAFVSMTGANPSSEESASLNELAGQFSSTKQLTAICSAIYSSIATQTL